MHRLASITSTGLGAVLYTYDTYGKLIKISRGTTEYRLTYDIWNRPIETKVGTTALSTNTYDSYGKLLTVTYANGFSARYEYDNLDRVSKIYQTENNTESLVYEMIYNGEGDLYELRNYRTLRASFFDYDHAGRCMASKERSFSLSGSTISYGNMISSYAYKYDECNNLTKLTCSVASSTWSTTYTYDKDNRPKTTTLSNGKVITNTYDALGRLASRKIGLNSDYIVAQELENQGYIFEAVMILLALGEDFDLSKEEIIQSVLEKKEWLLDHHIDFYLLRQRVAQAPKKVLQKYKDLFADDCPIMNRDEFAHVIRNNPYDDLFVISLIPSKLVTKKEIQMLCGFFNREWHKNSVSFSILQYIAKFSNDVACESFKSLDFEKIQYKRFSGDKQDAIKKLYESSLSLNTTKGKIQFMTITKRLDLIWENQILADLQQNSELCKLYVHAVSLAYERSITQTTARILGSLNTVYPMPPKVTSVLFKSKQYECYVVSKTLFDHRFTLELKEKGDFLWAEYTKIFKENKYKTTIKHMCDNPEFLQMMMDRKEYQDMDEEARINLASIYQDADSLLNVMEYGEDYALRYYSQMAGFMDERAATTFVDIVEKSQRLLSSQKLYDHAHDKLISGALKGRYTRLRNRFQY